MGGCGRYIACKTSQEQACGRLQKISQSHSMAGASVAVVIRGWISFVGMRDYQIIRYDYGAA